MRNSRVVGVCRTKLVVLQLAMFLWCKAAAQHGTLDQPEGCDGGSFVQLSKAAQSPFVVTPTSVIYNGKEYATLDNANPTDSDRTGCQGLSVYLPLPQGWQLAPGEKSSVDVTAAFGWGTGALILANRSSYTTANGVFFNTPREPGSFRANLGVQTRTVDGQEEYAVPNCNQRILIYKDASANSATTTEAAAPTTTTTTTAFNFAVFKTGVYCYDAGAAESMPSIAYRSFDALESRDECEDLCAADVHCNYYGWYPTTERCDRCVFYTTCKYQRKSVCIEESSHLPKIYKKSSENTTRPVAEKNFQVRADLTGKYCRGKEILNMPVATQAECHGNCSIVSKCTFAAYYFLEGRDAGPVEDATPDSCQAQCRLFSGCSNTVRSLCYPPATIWEASLPAP